MKLNGKEFDVIVATPGCGKSYLDDKYEDIIDFDEVRLRTKYVVPEKMTRLEIESTKGERKFKIRENFEELFFEKLDEIMKTDKIKLSAPHEEIIEYFIKNNIKYCYVYAAKEMKRTILDRCKIRGNSETFVDELGRDFDKYYLSNIQDTRPSVKYELKNGEYLEDVLKKAGVDFSKLK